MRGWTVFYLISLLFFTASCSKNNPMESLTLKKDVKQIIFFSDESNAKQEVAYYDAIIELKREFPREVDNMLVFSKLDDKKYFNSFNVTDSPAIMIIYNDHIVTNINGAMSKDEIVHPLTNALLK